MTATAAIATAATATASSALPSPRGVDLRDPAGDAGSFDRQFQAARQQRAPDHDAQHPTDSRDASARPHDADRPAHDQPQKAGGKPASPASAAQAAAGASTAAAAVATLTPANPGPDVAADETAVATASPLEDHAAASVAAASLAGAMLALLPSAAAALQPGGSATATTGSSAAATGPGTGATAVVDTGAATPLSTGDAGNAALTAAASAFVAGHDVLSTAAAAVPPPADSGKAPGDDPAQLTALLAAPPAAVSAAPQILQVQVPAGSPAFGHELGQQVAWLTGQGVKQASIRLHPEELGQLDVKISMNQGRVDVVFNAQHPAAVTAVQQTLPQLDHLLAQHGLSLGHAEVNQQQRGDRQDARSHARPLLAAGEVEDVQGIELRVSSGTVGLLDAFA